MEQKPDKKRTISPEMHASILVMVGFYVAYLGYQVYQGYLYEEGGMGREASIGFAIFFVVAGLAVVGFGVRMYVQLRRKEKADQAAKAQAEAAGKPDQPEEHSGEE